MALSTSLFLASEEGMWPVALNEFGLDELLAFLKELLSMLPSTNFAEENSCFLIDNLPLLPLMNSVKKTDI